MCKDRTAYVERLCQETFDIYCNTVQATHRMAIDPDVCQDVASVFADDMFENVATPLHRVVGAYLAALRVCDEEKATALGETFDAKMDDMKAAAVALAMARHIGGRLN